MRSLTRLLSWAVAVVVAASCIAVVALVVLDHRDDERRRVAALEEQRRAAEVQLAKLRAGYEAARGKIPDRKPRPFYWDQPWPHNDGPPLLLIRAHPQQHLVARPQYFRESPGSLPP